ncbi:MAG: D-arabinono-1,4-lactone oxidase [Solirubrobacteraceae bacterium]
MRDRNWAGNVRYSASRVHRPGSLDELRAIVATAPRIRTLGSRHSFNEIADAPEHVSLDRLQPELSIDRDAGTVTCSPWLTYGELAPRLHAAGLALPNLASLPHISLGGAIATATHGSGDRRGNLATAVAALELVTSDGAVRALARGEADFAGVVVGLGATGVVTRVTLDAEPSYELRQYVYEDLPWRSVEHEFDEITAAGESVSIFTRWGTSAGMLWVKRRDPVRQGPLFGARPAAHQLHPIAGADPAACSAQLGTPGPWFERLPHFRLEFTPGAGEELQSEYLLARADAQAAIETVRSLAPEIEPLLHIGEIRTVAGDDLWMSPQQGRDTIALHFTWRREQQRVEQLLGALEDALAPLRPRPHWGKLFAADAVDLRTRYPRLADFARLLARLDPRGAFRNDWLEQRVLGGEVGPQQ